MRLSRSDPKPTGTFLCDCSIDILFAYPLLWSGQTCNSLSQFPIPVDQNIQEGTSQILCLCPVS